MSQRVMVCPPCALPVQLLSGSARPGGLVRSAQLALEDCTVASTVCACVLLLFLFHGALLGY